MAAVTKNPSAMQLVLSLSLFATLADVFFDSIWSALHHLSLKDSTYDIIVLQRTKVNSFTTDHCFQFGRLRIKTAHLKITINKYMSFCVYA